MKLPTVRQQKHRRTVLPCSLAFYVPVRPSVPLPSSRTSSFLPLPLMPSLFLTVIILWIKLHHNICSSASSSCFSSSECFYGLFVSYFTLPLIFSTVFHTRVLKVSKHCISLFLNVHVVASYNTATTIITYLSLIHIQMCIRDRSIGCSRRVRFASSKIAYMLLQTNSPSEGW